MAHNTYDTARAKIKGGRYFFNEDVNMMQDGHTGELLGPLPRGKYRTPMTPDKEGMNIKDVYTKFGGPTAVTLSYPAKTETLPNTSATRIITGGHCARCNYHNPDCEYPEGGSYVCFNCR
jgi:hypothetical protein